MEKQFDLEYQYQEYLRKVKLKENEMSSVQRSEMRRTFIGACGVMLVILCDDLSKLDEDIAIKKIDLMFDQVKKFFLSETKKQN